MIAQVREGMTFVEAALAKTAEFLVNYSFEVIGACLILFLGWKIGQWTAKGLFVFLQQRKFDVTLSKFLAGGVKGLILGFAVIAALGKFGITIAPLIAALSALAFGSSFAIQGTLANLGAGLSLLVSRPFVVGDTITVAGISGVVEEVKLGVTTLSNEDGESITVPNKHIVGEILRNSRQSHVVQGAVGISYDADPARAIELIRATLSRLPDVTQTPLPQIGIQAFGDSAIEIGLRYWVPTKRLFQTRAAVNLAVYQALQQAGIAIPFPQRVVRLLNST